MFLDNQSFFSSKAVDHSLFYTTSRSFELRPYARIKEKEISTLKLEICSDRCLGFDYFSRFIKRIPNIKEVEIYISIKLQKEKSNPNSRIQEVLDFVIDSIMPQYSQTLETITFTKIQIQEKSEKDEEQTIKKYLLKILQPLQALTTISFRQSIDEVKASNFYELKQFLQLLKEKQLILPNLKMLDFEYKQCQNQVNLKSFNQKEIQTNMLQIAKDLSKILQIEELQMGIQNLGLEKVFFDHLMQSIAQIKNLKKLGLDISHNRISSEISLKNLKQLQSLSNQLEHLIYIDALNYKPSNIKEFGQIMKSFQNLKFLQLEQFSFKKGQYDHFFGFLPFMNQLEEIKLELDGVQFCRNDLDILMKQINKLEKLKSIHLSLPEEKYFMSEETVQNLIEILIHFQDQLIEFSIVSYSNIQQYDQILQLVDAISNLKNLEYLFLKFLTKSSIYNSVLVDARKQKTKNIWNLKQVEILQQRFFYSNVIVFLILLQFRIAVRQNQNILEEIRICQHQSYMMEKLDHQVNKELELLNKFTNIKIFSYTSNIHPNNFVNKTAILITNNVGTLTHLILSNNYNLKMDQLLKLLKKLTVLYYLDVQLQQVNGIFINQIFNQLIFLQKLFINQNDHFEVDEQIFADANYLTDFQCAYILGFKIMSQMLTERKAVILQNLIYSQIVQPQITYKPQFSHFDIVFD